MGRMKSITWWWVVMNLKNTIPSNGPDEPMHAHETSSPNAKKLAALVGQETKPSDWFEVTQERINAFADITEDRQFIHVGPEKAQAAGLPGTIAHGYLTLSLLTHLMAQSEIFDDSSGMWINYGSDTVRYLRPVRPGDRIRSHQMIKAMEPRKKNQWLVRIAVKIEIASARRPALVAEVLALWVEPES